MADFLPVHRTASPLPHGRCRTIQQALVSVGLPPSRVYAPQGRFKEIRVPVWGLRGTGGFWERFSLDALRDLYTDAHRSFKRQLFMVRHDFPENHEQATTLIGAWQHIKKLMTLHGVELKAYM